VQFTQIVVVRRCGGCCRASFIRVAFGDRCIRRRIGAGAERSGRFRQGRHWSARLPSAEPLSSGASNINGADTRSVIAPALPSVDLGANATAVDYLQVAQSALAVGT
jgi:hypothetical protein